MVAIAEMSDRALEECRERHIEDAMELALTQSMDESLARDAIEDTARAQWVVAYVALAAELREEMELRRRHKREMAEIENPPLRDYGDRTAEAIERVADELAGLREQREEEASNG